MKIAIIGAGFCGLATAWNLLNHPILSKNCKVQIFDNKRIGQGTSGMAAGLVHPFAGAHAKLNWRGFEALEATKELLKVANHAIQTPVIGPSTTILRVALTEMQNSDFQACALRYPLHAEWLDSNACKQLIEYIPDAPGLLIKEGYTVYAPLYLQGLWKACQAKGAEFNLQTITSLDELKDFDTIIIAAGYDSGAFPETKHLPLKGVKGQVLELEWPKGIPPLPVPLNSQTYIIMTEKPNRCLVGTTFERVYENREPDLEKAKEEILSKAFKLYPPLVHAKIIGCQAGMRGTLPQHRPSIQQVSDKIWAIIGMGSKGLLYHALFTKELVTLINQNK